jgi:hypothetical protein
MGDPCAAVCAREQALGCAAEATCLTTCQQVLASGHGCAAEIRAYYACYAEHSAALSHCTSMPDPCVVPFGNLLLCVEGHCSTAACTHEEDVCSCPALCDDRAVRSVCVGADCTCMLDGAVVGTCTDASIPICGLKESCCTVLYFIE